MANLELIADEQAELVCGGATYNFGAISPSYPVTSAPLSIASASFVNYGIQFSNVAGPFFIGPVAGGAVTTF